MQTFPIVNTDLTSLQHCQNMSVPISPSSLPLSVFTDSREECLALLAKVERLQQRLLYLQRKAGQAQSGQKRRKKNRRRNEELSKRFRCLLKECPKYYDSVTSLKYHMRVKHSMSIKKKRHQDGTFEVVPQK